MCFHAEEHTRTHTYARAQRQCNNQRVRTRGHNIFRKLQLRSCGLAQLMITSLRFPPDNEYTELKWIIGFHCFVIFFRRLYLLSTGTPTITYFHRYCGKRQTTTMTSRCHQQAIREVDRMGTRRGFLSERQPQGKSRKVAFKLMKRLVSLTDRDFIYNYGT